MLTTDGWRYFVEYVRAQMEWSERTFGPGTRTKGVVDHIRKELEEILADPGDVGEWIDIIILGIDGAWRCIAASEQSTAPEQVAEALAAKQARNFARVWPDWRTMSEDQAIEHDRSAELATVEPLPTPNTSPPIWDLVIADMQARDRAGRKRYGTPLQANNGRKALVDAYQEVLDLAVYLRQEIEERHAGTA